MMFRSFLQSYLLGYLFWAGVALGSLGFLLIHNITGGRWGAVIRRPLESAVGTIPYLVLLFVPIVVFLKDIYLWPDPAKMALDHVLAMHKASYLNVPFFLFRNVLYFSIWILLSRTLLRWSRRYDQTRDLEYMRKLRRLSAPGLLLYVFTVTFAAFDWMMSLDPKWHSSIYGMLVLINFGLTGLAFSVFWVGWKKEIISMPEIEAKEAFNDLGNLLLACVMLLAYMGFCQYLIIWNANISDEVSWYAIRSEGGWQTMIQVLLITHFLIPFLALLMKSYKRNLKILSFIAFYLLIVHWFYLQWLIIPAFSPRKFQFHFFEILVPAAIGLVWGGFFMSQIKRRRHVGVA